MSELGRPTIMTEEKVKEIEGYFSNGATDLEACFLAGISKQTLYNYQDEHPDFVDRKQALKDMIKYQARKKIKDVISMSSDVKESLETSKWYLERKDKDFKPKSDLTSNEEAIQPVLVKFLNGEPENNRDSVGV